MRQKLRAARDETHAPVVERRVIERQPDRRRLEIVLGIEGQVLMQGDAVPMLWRLDDGVVEQQPDRSTQQVCGAPRHGPVGGGAEQSGLQVCRIDDLGHRAGPGREVVDPRAGQARGPCEQGVEEVPYLPERRTGNDPSIDHEVTVPPELFDLIPPNTANDGRCWPRCQQAHSPPRLSWIDTRHESRPYTVSG